MPPPEPPLLVLVHGFLGFARLGPIAYFRGVEAMLTSMGVPVLIPTLPPAGTVAERAAALAAVLRGRREARFTLIGHSMGGLDARFAAAHLDPDHRIAAVTTVGTPHQGTAVAARILASRNPLLAIPAALTRSALLDLTPSGRRDNPISDRPDLVRGAYVAIRPLPELPLPLRPFARMMEGPNDGLVPESSAAWGTQLARLRADHFELVGWSLALRRAAHQRPFDHLGFWRQAALRAITDAG